MENKLLVGMQCSGKKEHPGCATKMSDRERFFMTGLPLGVLIGLAVVCVLTRTIGQTAAEVFVTACAVLGGSLAAWLLLTGR